MNIIQRIKAESSDLGKWFTIKIPAVLLIIAGAAESLEYVNAMPEGFIPLWVKQTLAVLAILGKLFGHLTVKKQME